MDNNLLDTYKPIMNFITPVGNKLYRCFLLTLSPPFPFRPPTLKKKKIL